ncbi:MAG TPA: hypothetical protein VFR24_17325 [Candidatus Angelobacter sp.]|nr:hypothetical protein [Candidatus Angelobacter sp.]
MSNNARTEAGRYVFKVKEKADGTPWLIAEPSSGRISMLENDAFIGFDLFPGTTLAQAYQIAEFMDQHLATMNLTVFDTHPLFGAIRS